ncbi:hypothetical protein CXR34_13470 [Microbacterium hominis]|uniref:Uncharacterized protein n=1 Tax=Microbacterium hominis TaxID=162426 RepID=A0A2K9DLH3_9MICO|nr:hypothetical protein CXR34_13470 [Microbacterium hominis]
MQRCSGPCGRLLLVADLPPHSERAFGNCWDCHLDRQAEHEGLDTPTVTASTRRLKSRVRGF